jgi:3-hydroxyisobutyrate dehydrogenase-like beta-hydroxyacid dehydrogenase
MAKLAFLGLGVMGFPMAGHLVAKGHSVTVYNRNPAKAKLWVERYGQTSAPTPAKAAKGADVVMACVGNDDDLRAVCLGPDGAFAGMALGAGLGTSLGANPLHQRQAPSFLTACGLAMRRAA